MKYIKSLAHNIEFTSFNSYNLRHKSKSRKNKHMSKRIKKNYLCLIFNGVMDDNSRYLYIF